MKRILETQTMGTQFYDKHFDVNFLTEPLQMRTRRDHLTPAAPCGQQEIKYIPTYEHEIDELLLSSRAKPNLTKNLPINGRVVRETLTNSRRKSQESTSSRENAHLTSQKCRAPYEEGSYVHTCSTRKSEQKLSLVNDCMTEIIKDLDPCAQKPVPSKHASYKSLGKSVNIAQKSVMEIVKRNSTERQKFSNKDMSSSVDSSSKDRAVSRQDGFSPSTPKETTDIAKRNYVGMAKTDVSCDHALKEKAHGVSNPFPVCDSRNYIKRNFKTNASRNNLGSKANDLCTGQHDSKSCPRSSERGTTDQSQLDYEAHGDHIYESIPYDMDRIVSSDCRKVPPALPPRPPMMCKKTETASIAKLITRSPRMGTKMFARTKAEQPNTNRANYARVTRSHPSRGHLTRPNTSECRRASAPGVFAANSFKDNENAVVTNYKKYTVNDVIESIRRVEAD